MKIEARGDSRDGFISSYTTSVNLGLICWDNANYIGWKGQSGMWFNNVRNHGGADVKRTD